MDFIILDTGVIINYLSDDRFRKLYNEKILRFNNPRILYPFAVKAEFESFKTRNSLNSKGSSTKKSTELENSLVYTPHSESLNSIFVALDVFARGKGQPRTTKGSYYLGKNDLWIAATNVLWDATLFTTDKDFEVLKSYNKDNKNFKVEIFDSADLKFNSKHDK